MNLLTLVFSWIQQKRGPDFKIHWVLYCFVGLSVLSLIFNDPLSQIDLYRHLKFLGFAGILTGIFLETLKTDKERDIGVKIAGLGALAFGLFSVVYNLAGYNVTHDYRLLGPLDAAVYLGFTLRHF